MRLVKEDAIHSGWCMGRSASNFCKEVDLGMFSVGDWSIVVFVLIHWHASGAWLVMTIVEIQSTHQVSIGKAPIVVFPRCVHDRISMCRYFAFEVFGDSKSFVKLATQSHFFLWFYVNAGFMRRQWLSFYYVDRTWISLMCKCFFVTVWSTFVKGRLFFRVAIFSCPSRDGYNYWEKRLRILEKNNLVRARCPQSDGSLDSFLKPLSRISEV